MRMVRNSSALKNHAFCVVFLALFLAPKLAYPMSMAVCRSTILKVLSLNQITDFFRFDFPPGAVEEALPETLEAKEPSSSRLARFVYRQQLVFRALNWSVAPVKNVAIGSERDFLSQFTPSVWYNFVVVDDSMMVGRAGRSIISQLVGKHITLSGTKKVVRAAGAFRIEKDGTLTLTNDSGTYRPSFSAIIGVASLLTEQLPGLKIDRFDYLLTDRRPN